MARVAGVYSLRSKRSGNVDRASGVLIGGFGVLAPIEEPCSDF